MSWVPTRGGSSAPDRAPIRVTYATDVIVAEGPISKLRHSRSAFDKGWNEWRSRFLVLQGPWLCCFSTTASPERGAAAPWAAPLTEVLSVLLLDASTFTLTASGRKLTLRAPSPSDATRWVRIIEAHASARQRSQLLQAAGGSVGLPILGRPAEHQPPTLPPRYSALVAAALTALPPPPPHRIGGGVTPPRVAGNWEGAPAAPPVGASSSEPQLLPSPPSSLSSSSSSSGGAPAQSAGAPPPGSGGRRRSIVAWGSSAALQAEGQQRQQQGTSPAAASAAGVDPALVAFVCEVVSPRDAAPPPLPFKFSSHEPPFQFAGHGGGSAASMSITTATQSSVGGGGSGGGTSGRLSHSPRRSRALPSSPDALQSPPASARSIFDTVSFAPLVVGTGRGAAGEEEEEEEGFAGGPRHWTRRLSQHQQRQQWGQPPVHRPPGGTGTGSGSSRASLPCSPPPPPTHDGLRNEQSGSSSSGRTTARHGGAPGSNSVPSGRQKGDCSSRSSSHRPVYEGRSSGEDCDDGHGSSSGSSGGGRSDRGSTQRTLGAPASAALRYGGRTSVVSRPTPPSSDAATTPTCSSCGKPQAPPLHPMPTQPDARPAAAAAAAAVTAAHVAAAASSAAIQTTSH